jgi:hypothetical protein
MSDSQPKIDRRTMAQNYGFALAFMNSDPELKRLFNKAVAQTWAPDKFVAQLRNTKWFKSNSAAVRNAILQESSDPATFQASLDAMGATVRDTYGSMFGDDAMDEKQMNRWAKMAVRMGWSQAELVDKITASVDYQKMLKTDALGGSAAEVKSQLDSLSSNYGVKLGDQWKGKQLAAIMSGDETMASVQTKVQEMAMREYKAFADRIAGGETITEIADPYVSRYAELLELNPNAVGLDDDLIQRAMRQTTPDGKAASMDLYTFEKEVRKDTRWQYTKNARQEVANVTSDLLKSFGVMS